MSSGAGVGLLDDRMVETILNELLKQASENVVQAQAEIEHYTDILNNIVSVKTDIHAFEETWRKISEIVNQFLTLQFKKDGTRLTIDDCQLYYVYHRGVNSRYDWYLDVPKDEKRRNIEVVPLARLVPYLPTSPNMDLHERSLLSYLFNKDCFVKKTAMMTFSHFNY